MMHRPSVVALCGAWLLSCTGPAAAQTAGDGPPAVAALAAAGRATLDRLGRQAAAWTTSTQLANGGRVVVEVLAAPGRRRTILSIEAQGRRTEAIRVVERDGSWYAAEGRKAGKYRPYEAPFELPTAYFFFGRSEPRPVGAGMDLGTFAKASGGVATYRTPLADPARRLVANALGEWERLRAEQPARGADPESRRAERRMRDLLRDGTATEVEVATGLVTRLGAADRETEFRDFRWLDRDPPGAFDVGATRWEDCTDDPTAGGAADSLLMIAHSGAWRPGMKSGDTDGRLLDLRTGRYRRIPFRGAMSLPGCFLPGRGRVAITGVDAGSGTMGLYEVDLGSGANRRLGGELLGDGITLMPALAPDGRTLAVLHKGTAGRLLDTQVCLVDLESGAARALGEPRDLAFPSWLPDGSGLVLLLREAADPANPAGPRVATIARMGRDGRLAKIRAGDMPVLLADGETILFEDAAARTWQTCNLDGGDARPYAGGLAGFGFPSPAPDGKRIVMMHFRPGMAPEPTILPLGATDGKPAPAGPGLWTTPAWR